MFSFIYDREMLLGKSIFVYVAKDGQLMYDFVMERVSINSDKIIKALKKNIYII